MPSFQVTGWANMGNPNTGNPFQFDDKQYVASVNLSWFKSAHAIRTGLDYSNQQINHFQPQGGTFQTARGTFTFNGNMTRLQNAAAPADARFNSWADFLLGLPNGAGKVEQLRNPNSVYMQAYAAYVQDQWSITRDLTINLGLRWSITRGRRAAVASACRGLDPDDGNAYTGGLSGVPLDTGVDLGPGEFLPRVGAAYRLGDKTVLRAGYGQSADPKPYIDFRNAYPINFAWSHPAITFNGVTERVPSGHDAAPRAQRSGVRAASRSLARHPAPAGRRGHDDVSEDGRAGAHPLLERDRSARAVLRRHRAGRLRWHARERTTGLHQRERGIAGNRQRGTAAVAVRHHVGHQHDQPVRRHDVSRAADGAEGARRTRSTASCIRSRAR